MSISADLANRLNTALASNAAGAELAALLNAGAVSSGATFTGGLTVTTVGVTITDVDIALGTTTGTKIGTATTQKLAFFGSTPIVQRAAYTQTYATADKTHANATATSVATTAATSTTPFGYAQAQADAIVAAVNALIVDVADVKQLCNSIIDDLQALGLAG